MDPLEGLDAPQPKNTPEGKAKEYIWEAVEEFCKPMFKTPRGAKAKYPGVIWHVCPEGMYLPAEVAHRGGGHREKPGNHRERRAKSREDKERGVYTQGWCKEQRGEPKD